MLLTCISNILQVLYNNGFLGKTCMFQFETQLDGFPCKQESLLQLATGKNQIMVSLRIPEF